MARKKNAAPSGPPEWIVTFSDLMALLACFFVLIISFSIQDTQKMQVVAGSMRDAFGVKKDSRKAGMIEFEGAPVRDYVKQVSSLDSENDSDFAQELHDQRSKQGPEANTHEIEKTDVEKPRQFATAAVSLRQAWQEMPELMEISSQLLVEEVPDGLNIQLVDEDGRSMFPDGSKYPYERTRMIMRAMAPVIAKLPNRIVITGHTSSDRSEERPGYGRWDLSADRANAVRRMLTEFGVPEDRFAEVAGKADTEPLFPEDTFLAANRRISILLLHEAPPLPINHEP
ncbi:MAG: flagellar motor protein MotB [Rhodobiaceae bacterium]|nr:flagellar motor protein MotB [Rhodobiaceae bacterium]MCC0015513.1 flagellar motor protein MotB [Rhodobiaceae bacterium]MCC0040921.1 flagellar motor protein MotB [Rhodobiaceae bacterium]MCC0053248.1 flagellar motor protein MotB [Rhodobiaceae bacterium]